MRLSSRLSDKSKSNGEVEAFIDRDKYTTISEEETDEVRLITAGDFVEIQIGKITLPFYSTICDDSVSFISPKRLHCLIVSDTMISIDCQLRCMDYDEENPKCRSCNPYVQAWFLVGVDDLSASSPRVNIVKQNLKLPDAIKLPNETADKFSEWLGKAEIAYRERLGAGAIIYLRSAFERITLEVGDKAGIAVYKSNGRSKPFDQVIKAVDEQCSIVPVIYSDNRYELFQKLSNIAHGNSDEETALQSYEPLRRLVVGVIENVKKKEEEIRNNEEIRKALESIGFSDGGESVE